MAREKANSCCNHPTIIAQVDMVDARNKQNLLGKKDDVILTKRKLQRDEGRIRAHRYFVDIKEVKLTWEELLFNDGKVGLDDDDGEENPCHCELVK